MQKIKDSCRSKAWQPFRMTKCRLVEAAEKLLCQVNSQRYLGKEQSYRKLKCNYPAVCLRELADSSRVPFVLAANSHCYFSTTENLITCWTDILKNYQ